MKKIAYGMVIIVTILIVQNVLEAFVPEPTVDVSAAVTNSVEQTFEEYDIQETLCQIEGYYYYGTRYMNDVRCVELLDRIADELGINSAYLYDVENTEEGYTATITKEGEQYLLRISSTTVEEQVGENVLTQRTYLSIHLDIRNSIESGYYYKDKIQNVMQTICNEELTREKEEGMTDNTNTSKEVNGKTDSHSQESLYLVIKGNIEGKMSADVQRGLGETLMNRLGADKVFDKVNEEMYNLYAYNRNMNQYISIGQDKINVNVAFAYNELENMTYVYVGSPIVNYDY